MMEANAIAKFKQYLTDNFGGDPAKAWDHYKDASGTMAKPDIIRVLNDADIGSRWIFTPDRIASVIIHELDKDGDGYVTWDEVKAFLATVPT